MIETDNIQKIVSIVNEHVNRKPEVHVPQKIFPPYPAIPADQAETIKKKYPTVISGFKGLFVNDWA
jgi:hypothetical protein